MNWIKDIHSSNRESNGELLRLLSMLFVLIHHFVVYAYPVDIRGLVAPVDAESMTGVLLNGLVYVAVNCFVLISGFYGIRFRWKGLLNLYLFVVFYNLLWMGAHIAIGDKVFTLDYLLKSVLVFTHGGAPWFIRAYVLLFCLSPILNKAIEYCTKKEFVLILGLLTILNVYLGYGYGVDGFNPNGYNYQQFVYVYVIGAYLKKHWAQERIDETRNRSLWVWLGCSLVWGGMTIASAYYVIPAWNSWTYNNPVVLLASIGFFCYVMSYHFWNKWINALAISTLSIYLMQTKCFSIYSSMLLHPVRNWILKNAEWALIPCDVLVVILGSMAFCVLSIAVDQIRLLIMTPLMNYLKKLDK